MYVLRAKVKLADASESRVVLGLARRRSRCGIARIVSGAPAASPPSSP